MTIEDLQTQLAAAQATITALQTNLDISRRGLPVPADYELAVLKIANEQLVIARDTEQTLHAAWEKRAYEAEATITALSQELQKLKATK